LYKNPYIKPPKNLGGEHVTMNLKLIPNDEILSKFLKTNFELVNGDIAGLDASNQ